MLKIYNKKMKPQEKLDCICRMITIVQKRILESYGFKATFPIETDILWQENKK